MKVFNSKFYVVLLITLLLTECLLGGFVGVWREWWWSALVKKEFWPCVWYIGEFAVVALAACVASGVRGYLANILNLAYRTRLTRKALKSGTYRDIEGGAQRVQDDCNVYPQLMISLGCGLTQAIIMITIFSVIILQQVSVVYFIFPILYSVIGTLLAGYIAHPLIALNYLNQVAEAAFRQFLTKAKYNIAFRNNYQMYKRTKYLSYFQTFYSQITVIVPYIMLSFVYFGGIITFGVLMQLASSMIEVINNMSYFISSFNDLNRFLSCRKRLREIKII